MKRVSILCVLCVLCGPAYGTNEIRSFNAGATTCFAVVRNTSGQVWYVTGQVFETWGTAERTMADYQDQVNEILQRVKRISAGSEF